MNHLKATFM